MFLYILRLCCLLYFCLERFLSFTLFQHVEWGHVHLVISLLFKTQLLTYWCRRRVEFSGIRSLRVESTGVSLVVHFLVTFYLLDILSCLY